MSGQSQAEPRRWTLRGARLERVTAERIEPRDQLEALERVKLREDRAVAADIEAVAQALVERDLGASRISKGPICAGYKDAARHVLAAVFSEIEDA